MTLNLKMNEFTKVYITNYMRGTLLWHAYREALMEKWVCVNPKTTIYPGRVWVKRIKDENGNIIPMAYMTNEDISSDEIESRWQKWQG